MSDDEKHGQEQEAAYGHIVRRYPAGREAGG